MLFLVESEVFEFVVQGGAPNGDIRGGVVGQVELTGDGSVRT